MKEYFKGPDGNRLTNFIIVEITPIGIQNIGWKFCKRDQLCFSRHH